jgi:hypothetical protein
VSVFLHQIAPFARQSLGLPALFADTSVVSKVLARVNPDASLCASCRRDSAAAAPHDYADPTGCADSRSAPFSVRAAGRGPDRLEHSSDFLDRNVGR